MTKRIVLGLCAFVAGSLVAFAAAAATGRLSSHPPAPADPAADYRPPETLPATATAEEAAALSSGASTGGSEGHAAPDLAADAPAAGTTRAPVAFRPDPTAPVDAGLREALRPA